MAQRTVALCDGKLIGIETIFTVVNGRQINIPDKLELLRAKSRNNELFCPCGCGANLILVAGDKNLREQHFRIKDADNFQNCHMVTEGKTSVDSKIVLKCWLDDNLNTDDVETRVPISALSDSTRKYEFSFISRNCRIAVNYCHDKVNLSDEKLQILEENANGVSVIHVVDIFNGGCNGQYPEGLMKVQNRQGYCLLLAVEGPEYNKADLRAVFYEKDIDGFWREVTFASGDLKAFRILPDVGIIFNGKNLSELIGLAKEQFFENINIERNRRAEVQKQREAYLNRLQLEEEQQKEELKRRQDEIEKLRAERAKNRRLEEEKIAAEERRREEEFIQNIKEGLKQQEIQVRDPNGNRWIRCEFCGKIAKDSEFSSYGGAIGVHLNLGTCKECSEKNTAVNSIHNNTIFEKPKKVYNPTVCPECGKKLVERDGRNGKFIGCTGFPNCRYSRSLRQKKYNELF